MWYQVADADRPHLRFEGQHWLRGLRTVAGVDEAGCGPLAGPVVAAAVVFPPGMRAEVLAGVHDSKRLSPKARAALVDPIRAQALSWSVAVVDVDVIDRLNILTAAREAAAQAVCGLGLPVEHALVDGLYNPRLSVPQTPLVGGDATSLTIAAASVLAKEHRDALMRHWDAVYPGYGFAEHKGYPTRVHREALARLGPCPIHRKSFRGVCEPLPVDTTDRRG